MLIGISGTLSSGKTEVARYLTFQGFKLLVFKENGDKEVESSGSCESASVIDIKELSISNDDITTKEINNGSMEPYNSFNELDELLEYVTTNWRMNFVISHISDIEMLNSLQKRPFFLHISIDAPIQLRFKRFSIKQKRELSIEEFIYQSDRLLFSSTNPLIEINNQAQIKIINTSASIKSLYVKLSELNLLNQERLRPTWDSYFMRLADLAALRSNCMKRRVGCVVVRGNRVMATGYNGTPRNLTNCNEGGCSRCNQGQGSGAALSTCLCLHAEENALLEAGRDRITGGQTGENSVLYCNTCPCLTCSIKIVQSGIKEVVYAQSYSMDILSHKVMSEANIILRQYSPPTDGIFI
ncbi:DEHA2D04598p [Debaryomyces hansenii CBS767]|uniref:Deoxycytidylate deaminase n=1 Tax=Debaryomyces hansenii (strain ATCC 36239 / CBS 767 / BCRC 21394 / JCM 1990 / NBRC 0083 / IGC 2968) TaxID=284592 RepID=Q6BT04_DEBHA|nr:DEHA2D04598p [Debaryomyces hansenii CBS767]CAG86805.2 DEHA2D04598p [Debaryomyces hansenii CBS767]|eukprot:XP_458666.2 DEHA2D04598p [Debaryomyces hansenii CBS767]